MWQFLWLGATLSIATAFIQDFAPLAELNLPGGLPDGSLITFYFWHRGNNEAPEAAVIDFFDFSPVGFYQLKQKEIIDISARIRIDRHDDSPVHTKSLANDQWQEDVALPIDNGANLTISNGWWRVDAYKHDNYRMSVFYQGFSAGLRTFQSLNNIKSACLSSYYVVASTIQMELKYPKTNFPPISYQKFYNNLESTRDVKIESGLTFPVGSRIEMKVLLRPTNGKLLPELQFVQDSYLLHGQKYFLLLRRERDGEVHKVALGSDFVKDNSHTLCGYYAHPFGELLHLSLSRDSYDAISLEIRFHGVRGDEGGTYCYYSLPAAYAIHLDRPFDIMSRAGAMILHLDHFVARPQIKEDY